MFHNDLVDGSSPTSLPRRTPASHIGPFSGNAQKRGLFVSECKVFDQVSWSNTPMFHNALVVGSSPTSSTTQSSPTGESGLCSVRAGRACCPRVSASEQDLLEQAWPARLGDKIDTPLG